MIDTIDFPDDGQLHDYAANLIAENLNYASCDPNLNHYLLLGAIFVHCKHKTALVSKADAFTIVRGRQHDPKKSTRGGRSMFIQ
jgi:hypothetical protein